MANDNFDLPRPANPVPSATSAVINDDAKVLDYVVNSTGTVTTRTGKVILTLDEALKKFGFGIADFTFADGGTLSSLNLLISNSPTDGFLYKYVGSGNAPVAVSAGTDPTASGNWQAFSATNLQSLGGLTSPSDLAQRHRIKTTVAEIATGVFKVGDLLEVVDRGNERFKIEVGTTNNGMDIIIAGAMSVATLQFTDKVNLDALGVATTPEQGTSILQRAVDMLNAKYVPSKTGSGGGDVVLPPRIVPYNGFTLKPGVGIVGQGSASSILELYGNNNTGIKSPARATGLAADQLSQGGFSGFGMYSDPLSSPVGQTQWDMIGFSYWDCEDLFIEWFNGCTGVSALNSTLAGAGGPAQWYNTMTHCFLIRPQSRPAGGVAFNLGDTSIDKEQVTALTMIGGRVASASQIGTGLALRGTGNTFVGVTFEGLGTAVDLGSGSTRGANGNTFSGCYWEANTINRRVRANAASTLFSGSFITGGSDDLQTDDVSFNDASNYKAYQSNSAFDRWEVFSQNPLNARPKFRSGSSLSGFGLVNSAGTELIFDNGHAASADHSYFRLITGDYANEVFSVGLSTITAGTDGAVDIGRAVNRFNTAYLATAPIVGSDYRIKKTPRSMSQELLDFALSVELKHFEFKDGTRSHSGVIITEEFLSSLDKVMSLDSCAAFCRDIFTDAEGNPITKIIHGVELGDLWQVRHDEWQNILLEAMRRKIVGI